MAAPEAQAVPDVTADPLWPCVRIIIAVNWCLAALPIYVMNH